jgi:hypothetical protein
MKFPKTVKVGLHKYKITLAKGIKDADGADLYGCHSHSDLEISIDCTKPPALLVETLIHELTHALIEHYNLKQNEKYVDCTSRGFLMLMRDNPKLFQDILAELK